MANQNPIGAFDQYYYAHGCGKPYQRDDEWLTFFDQIAKRIIRDIQPKSILDAGCAWGFLVEGLRKNGGQAWGIDISEYAIGHVSPEVKPFCWVGSIIEPFPQKYDLIVSIEVVEHLQKAESERAIENICRHTDDVLISSTPFDYKESTHFNVQPPEYWAEQFAYQGFFRDVDFDASFINPWAVRFKRSTEPMHRVVRDYERKYWLLWKENTDLRNLTGEMRAELTGNQRHIQELDSQLQAILNSRSWRLMQKLQAIRLSLLPLGSRRELAVKKLLRGQFGSGKLPEGIVDQYPAWIDRNEPGSAELLAQREDAQSIKEHPLISIVTPVLNPSAQVLSETLASVQAQTYPFWELCIVDGGSTNPKVKDILAAASTSDPRIRVKLLDHNEGISGNSNAALQMAQGDYILFLDHDDLLSDNTLYEVVKTVSANPDADFIYYDEDKTDDTGKIRRDPFFKPDWSPEMLLSANYLTHPVIRKSLLDRVGVFKPEFDGTQDWDLAFRCTEQTEHVIHIPKVLYHWRQVSGSTARDFNAKAWVFERQKKAIQDHLGRIGLEQPDVEFTAPGIIRTTWASKHSLVSIIIPTLDHVGDLEKCLSSIFRGKNNADYEIILVDNGSHEPETLAYYERLKTNPRIQFVSFTETFNYSRAINLGARHATGDLLLILNNDVEATDSDWLDEMVRWAQLPEIGIVGAKLLYPDGTLQHAGVILGMGGHADHIFCHAPENSGGIFGSTEWYRDYSAVTAACMMLRRGLFEQVGGFDEAYQLVYSDVDLCLRILHAGYRNMYTPFARLIHYEGKTRTHHFPVEDMRLGCERFKDKISIGDPYFNPNLSYATQIPSLKPENEEGRVERLFRMVDLSSKAGS